MRILFIYPSSDFSYPVQIGALSSYIKKSGHQSHLLNLLIKNKIEDNHFLQIKKTIEELQPDFVGLTCYETAFVWVKVITEYVKKIKPDIKTIVGGYFPTLCPREVIEVPSIDIICRGEGEEALEELFKNRKIDYKIRNLWFKKGGQIIRNPIRPLIENLDNLPFPDKDILNFQKHLDLSEKKGERIVKIMASRGCPYACTYCCNKYLRQLYPNKEKYLRMRSPKNVIAEIKFLKNKYQFEKIGFHDDNLTLDKKWLKIFCQIYTKEINLPFYCAARPESCTDEIIDLLKKAGCYLLLIGVEHGDENYRQKTMKREMTNQQIDDAFKKARRKGVMTWSFTMVGLPYETRIMRFKTLFLNWRCRPDFVMASIFYPFRGTWLGDLCYKNNLVDLGRKEKVSSYAWESILNQKRLTLIEVKLMKYLNGLTAFRSGFFWKQLFVRINDLIKYGRRL